MIQAIKNTTLTDLQVKTLNIREKELNYWNSTFQTMASQSALLAGFCYAGLNIHIDDKDSTLLTFGYLATTTLAMSCGLLCITISTFCVMFGPGLALRGQDGAASMHKAVENLKSESKICFRFFIIEMLCFHISSFLLMWIYYSKTVALIINIILGIFLIAFISNGLDIIKKLYVNDDDAVSGKFNDFGQYEDFQDLDRGATADQRFKEIRRQNRGSDDIIPRQSLRRLEENKQNEQVQIQAHPFGAQDAYKQSNSMMVNAFKSAFLGTPNK